MSATPPPTCSFCFDGPDLKGEVKQGAVGIEDGHPAHCRWEAGLSFKVKGNTPFQSSKSGESRTGVTMIHHGLGVHDMARLMMDDSKLVHPHTKAQLSLDD